MLKGERHEGPWSWLHWPSASTRFSERPCLRKCEGEEQLKMTLNTSLCLSHTPAHMCWLSHTPAHICSTPHTHRHKHTPHTKSLRWQNWAVYLGVLCLKPARQDCRAHCLMFTRHSVKPTSCLPGSQLGEWQALKVALTVVGEECGSLNNIEKPRRWHQISLRQPSQGRDWA